MTSIATASPSLALIKYWGKLDGGVNLPATPSLAVTLDSVKTTTTISTAPAGAGADTLSIDGKQQDLTKFLPVINAIRKRVSARTVLDIQSTNDFPTAAGLASSSSGFAALTLALDRFFGAGLSQDELSGVARLGSGSAARAVYGGFTTWETGAAAASQLAGPEHWPGLRVLVVVINSDRKPLGSREGMTRSSESSPYYESWIDSSEELFARARAATLNCDLPALGPAMRQSYLRMFSTMFTSEPPLIYWIPESLAVIRLCDQLRSSGVEVWETMDAGPQVKLLLESAHVETVRSAVKDVVPGCRIIECAVGPAPTVEDS